VGSTVVSQNNVDTDRVYSNELPNPLCVNINGDKKLLCSSKYTTLQPNDVCCFSQKIGNSDVNDNTGTPSNNLDSGALVDSPSNDSSKNYSNKSQSGIGPGPRALVSDCHISDTESLTSYNKGASESSDTKLKTPISDNNNKEIKQETKKPKIRKPKSHELDFYDENAPDGTEDWGPMPFRKSTDRWHYILVAIIWYKLYPLMFAKAFFVTCSFFFHLYVLILFRIQVWRMTHRGFRGKEFLRPLLPRTFKVFNRISLFIIWFIVFFIDNFLILKFYLLNKFDDLVSYIVGIIFSFCVLAFVFIPVFFIELFYELVRSASRNMPNLYYKTESSVVKALRSYVFILMTMFILLLLCLFFFNGFIAFIFKTLCALFCKLLLNISNLLFSCLGLHCWGHMVADILFLIYS